MDHPTQTVSFPLSIRMAKEWPQDFSQSRKPNDNRPYVEAILETLNSFGQRPFDDGIRLFMECYVDGISSFDAETVVRFCQNVDIRDLMVEFPGRLASAWLYDYTQHHSPIPDLSTSGSDSLRTATALPSGDIDHRTLESEGIPLVDTELDITDANSQVGPVSPFGPVRAPRTYSAPLTAKDLHDHLKKKRFDHETLLDADRRLIYVANPDPLYVLAIVMTTSEHQRQAVQDTLWKHLSSPLQASLKVKLLTLGYRVFQLEFHLPYHAMRLCPARERSRNGTKKHRGWTDLSFLTPTLSELEGDILLGIHQAQISLVICGSDDTRWVAYAFEDTDFDKDREIGEDEFTPDFQADQIALGKLDAKFPLSNPREYFLSILLIRVRQIYKEWKNLVRAFECGYEECSPGRPFYTSSHRGLRGENKVATSYWTRTNLLLLCTLLDDLSRTNQTWTSFMLSTGDVNYFLDHNATSTISNSHVARTLNELNDVFNDMRDVEDRLRRVNGKCREAVHSLEFGMSVETSKNTELTILYISPIVIVSTFFAIPTPIMSFERNGLSFALAVVLLAFVFNLMLWLRARNLLQPVWMEKVITRMKLLHQGDPSIVTVNEAGAKVLRRRRMQVNFSRPE